MHSRNLHQQGYDFQRLIETLPALADYARDNGHGRTSIDFSDPIAVKTLNRALLAHHYEISDWDIPHGYLCPPIPGRADYLHHLADLLAKSNQGKIPKGARITGLDIGTGANLIYPILGNRLYQWAFIGAEIDPKAIQSAHRNIEANPPLPDHIEIRQQQESKHIFRGIIQPTDLIDFTLCNPPFHSSATEAREAATRKVKNLGKHTGKKPVLNFAGQSNELWYEGGEVEFIRNMIRESAEFGKQVFWFTSLVSQERHLKPITQFLKRVAPAKWEIIDMGQGNKRSRYIAWTFFNSQQRKLWSGARW
ncbi:23S rRNA (adenine(1618)-N(6))-methyltransferase RlmF [Pontibacter sp. G13]|uniref:23S rRNA (adenine(1618)-N(6))-methyltransferase RlmF n=1 Tax=Pontibacter sp. G13 TaxID=3074898 RepID=UPI00288A30C5|nr:23S rRNA (adenine(1618)-N(6))-methyltransferase RlmF [Pontibacter sp. G13]WNJ18776.1 23S rRNA (adenine(1618)-N(6))-methyltransferase RlmF [Pontibacter sp. G13]